MIKKESGKIKKWAMMNFRHSDFVMKHTSRNEVSPESPILYYFMIKKDSGKTKMWAMMNLWLSDSYDENLKLDHSLSPLYLKSGIKKDCEVYH